VEPTIPRSQVQRPSVTLHQWPTVKCASVSAQNVKTLFAKKPQTLPRLHSKWGRGLLWGTPPFQTPPLSAPSTLCFDANGVSHPLIPKYYNLTNAQKVCLSVCLSYHSGAFSAARSRIPTGVFESLGLRYILPLPYPTGSLRGLSCRPAISIVLSAAYSAAWRHLANDCHVKVFPSVGRKLC